MRLNRSARCSVSLRGQAMLEYLLLCSVLLLALLTPWSGQSSPAQQLLQAQSTIKDYWDQIMRLRAEMENNRKRGARDVENAHKYALKSFVDNLLPVIDSRLLIVEACSVVIREKIISRRAGSSTSAA